MRIVIRLGTIFNVSLVLGLAFIFIGDKVLPQPLGNVSENTRITLHKTIAKFVREEKQEFSNLKGGEATTKVKFQKPGTYFERSVTAAENQVNTSQ
ncbi:hypothetical protein VB715_20685 [Crocosphaera sp. UHCC 0190]|uniref:hypothetical protein n=1 Tax=Crocosphaera sp. UHCC 0190 TaxID=3110246 RepID=UPI002B1E956B|nr:hypothetical protein [Crocosphaera sp. UHCC 0190]MEA5512194.1 hypothetical protein [Crocosphaera sp. UHCC 0190]